MNLQHLIEATRTCRRFVEDAPIDTATLRDLVDLARLAGSARNCQPWQYGLINDSKSCAAIFPFLGWAGYLRDWPGPPPGERPSGYILCLLNHHWTKSSTKEAYFDLGIASQNLLLGATAHGLAGCRIGSFSPAIAKLFALPDTLSLELVIALGQPGEDIIVEPVVEPENIAYWRDEQGRHHVPKRGLDDILIPLTLVERS